MGDDRAVRGGLNLDPSARHRDPEAPRRLRSIRTTASQAIASARPMGPTCSPVLALTLTAVGRDPEEPGDAGAEGGLVRAELGLLGVDDQVAVDRPPALARHPVDDLGEEPAAVEPAPLGVGVGVVLADVPQAGRARAGRRPGRAAPRRRRSARPGRADGRDGPPRGSAGGLRRADACRDRYPPARRPSLPSRNPGPAASRPVIENLIRSSSGVPSPHASSRVFPFFTSRLAIWEETEHSWTEVLQT